MTEEDYWASDPDFDEIIKTAATQGETLLTEAKRERPTFRDYQIKPLYESNRWQSATAAMGYEDTSPWGPNSYR